MSDNKIKENLKNKNPDLNNEKKYKVKIKTFEGPLDLLLHLVRTSEIDIYDIPIAEITKQYLNYLSLLVVLDLDNISEFIEMATTLILIKSKAMLPTELEFDEEENDLREELIAKLLEYQKYKMAAGLLEARSEDSIPFINKNKGPVLFELEDTEDENWRQLSVLDLIGAFVDVLNSKDQEDESGYELNLNDYTVEEKLDYIFDMLEDCESFNYFDIIAHEMQKLELVCTFLAILELVKKGVIIVRQHIIFGDIHIVKRKGVDIEKIRKGEVEV